MAEGMGGKIVGWAEAHPGESILIGGVVVLGVMWLLGFFDGAPAQSDGGASNMAAAYYAAEAQQAVVGGQIQIATIGAAASTAQALAGDDAAVKINKAQTHAATIINGQNADTTTKLGGFALNATYSNNATSLAQTQSNNAAAVTINSANNLSSTLSDFLHNIWPTELATYGGNQGFVTSIPGLGTFQSGGALSPAQMMAAGYSPQAIAAAGG